MGTVMNGKKWNGACINGKIIGGAVKDGILFYKKMNSLIYKRRIMLNDNLRNLTIYSEFLNGHYIKMDLDDTYNYIVVCNQLKDDGIFEKKISNPLGDDDLLITSFFIDQEFFYKYDSESQIELQNNAKFNNDKNYIVTSIQESPSYRCLFIEDPNIRPLRVNDTIIAGTKLYFIFPDNFNPSVDESCIHGEKFEIMMGNVAEGSFVAIKTSDEATNVIFASSASPIGFFNLSFFAFDYNVGKVISIDNNIFSQYIYVDKTTLGT